MKQVTSAPAFRDGTSWMATLRENLAANLRRLIRERGYTQRSFAKAIGVDEAVLSKWLNLVHFPDDRFIDKMIVVLGVPYGELVKDPHADMTPVPSRDIDAVIKDLARLRGYDIVKKS